MEKSTITCIHKKKSKKEFENYRGVFRVQILRSILYRLMYNDSYYTINSSLTDGNVVARKLTSVRDNIFVIGATTNSVICGKSKSWMQSNALIRCGFKHVLTHYMKLELIMVY